MHERSHRTITTKPQKIHRLVPDINARHILHEVLLPARAREPQVPRDDVGLDRVADVAGVADSGNNALALLESGFDARAAQLLVGVEGFFHGVGLALFDPAGQAAGEEDGVFEDDAGGFTLRGHGVLGESVSFCRCLRLWIFCGGKMKLMNLQLHRRATSPSP